MHSLFAVFPFFCHLHPLLSPFISISLALEMAQLAAVATATNFRTAKLTRMHKFIRSLFLPRANEQRAKKP